MLESGSGRIMHYAVISGVPGFKTSGSTGNRSTPDIRNSDPPIFNKYTTTKCAQSHVCALLLYAVYGSKSRPVEKVSSPVRQSRKGWKVNTSLSLPPRGAATGGPRELSHSKVHALPGLRTSPPLSRSLAAFDQWLLTLACLTSVGINSGATVLMSGPKPRSASPFITLWQVLSRQVALTYAHHTYFSNINNLSHYLSVYCKLTVHLQSRLTQTLVILKLGSGNYPNLADFAIRIQL